jgi:hypothetical protein
MEKILTIDKNKIAVVVEYSNIKRKLIHQWFNSLDCDYYHRSFSSSHFRRDYKILERYYKCDCGNKIPIASDDYHEGYMENNRDEYYSLRCDTCYEYIRWEPNYDSHDDVKYIYVNKNNMIVYGDYIKHCKKPITLPESDSEYDKEALHKYFETATIHIIDAPTKIMSNKKFLDFIYEKIK